MHTRACYSPASSVFCLNSSASNTSCVLSQDPLCASQQTFAHELAVQLSPLKKNLQYIQGFHVYLGTKPTYKVTFSSWHTKHYTNVKRQSQNFLVPCIPRISDPCCKSQAQSQRMIFPLCFSGPRHFLRELAELGTLVMVTWEKHHPCSLTGNDANRINEARFFLLQEGRQR